MTDSQPWPVLLDHRPNLGLATFVAPTATVVGWVEVSTGVTLWYGAVLRGDVEKICLGSHTNIQDGAILHGDPGQPTILGSHVTVGHRAVIHGAQIEDGCLIGIGSIVLNGVTVGTGSIIGAGAVVTKSIPPRSLVIGIPAKVIREVSEAEAEGLIAHAHRYEQLGRQYAQQSVDESGQ